MILDVPFVDPFARFHANNNRLILVLEHYISTMKQRISTDES